MQYTISNKLLSVTVDSIGAQLTSVVFRGKERLWQNENGSWADHAPVLFPVCGKCAMIVDGKDYNITKHGVVRHAEFELDSISANQITLVTHNDEQTLQQYPFAFDFAVTYKVSGSKLKIVYSVTNNNDREMPYSCGTHVSFALPTDPDNYEIAFPRQRDITLLCHNEDGYLTGEVRKCGVRKSIGLEHEYLDDGFCLIFRYIADGSLILRNRNTKRKVAKVVYNDYPHLLLWHSPNSHMICIEPWHNIPDNIQDLREFAVKDGVASVQVGCTAQICQTIKYFKE